MKKSLMFISCKLLDVKSKTAINRTHSLLVPADCLSPGHHVKYHKVLGFLTFECTSMYNLTRNNREIIQHYHHHNVITTIINDQNTIIITIINDHRPSLLASSMTKHHHYYHDQASNTPRTTCALCTSSCTYLTS